MISSTFGAPFGGTTDGGQYAFESFASSLITPPNFGGSGGSCLPSIEVVARPGRGPKLMVIRLVAPWGSWDRFAGKYCKAHAHSRGFRAVIAAFTLNYGKNASSGGKPESHRPVVCERDLHVGTEYTGRDLGMSSLCGSDQMVEKTPAVFRIGSGRKAWSHSLHGIGGKGELRHQ